MGKIILFPVVRRHPHVVLYWDKAWDKYRVEPIGHGEAAELDMSFRDHGMALDYLMTVGDYLKLPMVDLTDGRGATA